MAEMMMENGKGDGRGLLDALEAGLDEEDLADGDAVKTASQRAVRGADFDRVRISFRVQRHEGAERGSGETRVSAADASSHDARIAPKSSSKLTRKIFSRRSRRKGAPILSSWGAMASRLAGQSQVTRS